MTKRLPYGAARVAFERNRERVVAGLREKKTLRMIYDELRDDLAMPIRTFRWHCAKLKPSATRSQDERSPGQPERPADGFKITKRSKEEIERLFGRKP